MTVSITPITDQFGAVVSGVDLRQPLTPEEAAAIDAGMDKYAVLVIRGQDLTDEQQVAFSMNFGEMENKKGGNIRTEERVNQQINDVSNLDNNNQPFDRNDRRRFFQPRQSSVALGQFVPPIAGEIFAALGALDPERRRQHRVRRYARGLRRAR